MAIDQARQQGREASERAEGKAKDVASQAKEQVQQTTEEVRGQASQRLRQQVDQRSSQLGEQATSVAQAMHKAADHLGGEGNDAGAKATHRAAEQVDRLGGYLSRSDADAILGDVESLARRRPWLVGALGAAAGFVGARFLKASSENRYAASYQAGPPRSRLAAAPGDGRAASLPPVAPAVGTSPPPARGAGDGGGR